MVDSPECGENDVLESLADADCRAILRETHSPRTAPEISDLCEIPLSTVYRKVDRLTEQSLLETRIRIDSDGRHPTQYERRIDGLLIQLGPRDELNVSVYTTADAGSATREEAPRQQSDGGSDSDDVSGDDEGSPEVFPVEVQFVDEDGDSTDGGTVRASDPS